jgi:hypothetical protein
MEFAGLPWDVAREKGLGRPQTGSALDHLVTSGSVKKALMEWLQFPHGRHSGATRQHRARNLEIPGSPLRTIPE